MELVLRGLGEPEAGDCLPKPCFQHLPGRRARQEPAETSMRLYWTPAALCLWPKLRANLSSRVRWSEGGRAWGPSRGTPPRPTPTPALPLPASCLSSERFHLLDCSCLVSLVRPRPHSLHSHHSCRDLSKHRDQLPVTPA